MPEPDIQTNKPQQDRYGSFRDDLENIINRHSMENGSDTPDFILAKFLTDCLAAWDLNVSHRTRWYAPPAKDKR